MEWRIQQQPQILRQKRWLCIYGGNVGMVKSVLTKF